jgi:hypothetical protein
LRNWRKCKRHKPKKGATWEPLKGAEKLAGGAARNERNHRVKPPKAVRPGGGARIVQWIPSRLPRPLVLKTMWKWRERCVDGMRNLLALLPERNPFGAEIRWLRSFLASPPANFSAPFRGPGDTRHPAWVILHPACLIGDSASAAPPHAKAVINHRTPYFRELASGASAPRLLPRRRTGLPALRGCGSAIAPLNPARSAAIPPAIPRPRNRSGRANRRAGSRNRPNLLSARSANTSA